MYVFEYNTKNEGWMRLCHGLWEEHVDFVAAKLYFARVARRTLPFLGAYEISWRCRSKPSNYKVVLILHTLVHSPCEPFSEW